MSSLPDILGLVASVFGLEVVLVVPNGKEERHDLMRHVLVLALFTSRKTPLILCPSTLPIHHLYQIMRPLQTIVVREWKDL